MIKSIRDIENCSEMQMYNPISTFSYFSVENFTGSTGGTTVALSQSVETKGRKSPSIKERCIKGEVQVSKTCSSSYQT